MKWLLIVGLVVAGVIILCLVLVVAALLSLLPSGRGFLKACRRD